MSKLGEIDARERPQMQARIGRLENSRDLVGQVNRRLGHSIMLPLNSVCLVPARVVETNQVRSDSLCFVPILLMEGLC